MQLHGIRAKGKRRFKVTTDSRHDLPISPNLLNREFVVSELDKVWVGDITYIATDEGWLFLAVVIDLFSRQVVDWSLRHDMTRDIVIYALRMAWFKRHPSKQASLMFHSDRGSQYASKDFRDVLKGFGFTSSMSRRGNCWDNACNKTLFGSLKVERLYRQRFKTRRAAKLGCIRRWTKLARCSSSKTGSPISPSKPTHELGYGIRISGAISNQITFMVGAVRSVLL
jgi:putative transposase